MDNDGAGKAMKKGIEDEEKFKNKISVITLKDAFTIIKDNKECFKDDFKDLEKFEKIEIESLFSKGDEKNLALILAKKTSDQVLSQACLKTQRI